MLYELPGVAAERVLLVGCGKRKESTTVRPTPGPGRRRRPPPHTSAGGGPLHPAAAPPGGLDRYLAVRDAVTTAADKVYRYSTPRSDKQAPKTPLKRLHALGPGQQETGPAEQALRHGAAIAAGRGPGQGTGQPARQHLHPDLPGRPGPRPWPSDFHASRSRSWKRTTWRSWAWAPCSRSPAAAASRPSSSSCTTGAARRAPSRWSWWARASPSTPAASRSSPPPTWTR